MKYVLTGSAGNITKPLALALLEKGHDVTVIGRNAENLLELTKAGATAAVGTVEDLAFLTETFTGADAVYTMIPPKWDATDWKGFIAGVGKLYAAAIEAAGVKKVVNLSSVGAHLPDGCGPVSGLFYAEAALDALYKVDVLHLRPAYFYTNLFANIAMVKHMGIIGSNFGGEGVVIPIVHPNDIADVAFEALDSLSFAGKSVRYIASDEVSSDEIAAELGKAIEKPELPWVVFTNEQAYGGMVQNGLSEEVAKNYTELGNAMQDGTMSEDYLKHKPALGKTKLADFAAIFGAVYLQS